MQTNHNFLNINNKPLKTTPPCDYLIFDITNLLYRTFFVHKNETDATLLAGLAHHSALMTIRKYFNQFRPSKKIIMCFDRSSWRKQYTNSEKAISNKPYKGNRRINLTKSQQQKYKQFINHLREFEKLIDQHTTIISLAGDRLEADDIISQLTKTLSDQHLYIISSDKDLLQLISSNIKIINPATNKQMTLSDWDNNNKLFVFEKCIRGDISDNIQSAFPRCRKNKIHQAFGDDYHYTNLMKTTWTDQNNNTFTVEDLYKENMLLIDLDKQPQEIKQQMKRVVDSQLNKSHTFDYFKILKFLGEYQLNQVSKNINNFVPMLSL